MFGLGGNDTLAASLFGADRREGGAGRDRLVSTGGGDRLVGDPGGYTFALGRYYASDFLGADADVILDFCRGPDRIDLRVVDADGGEAGVQGFSFVVGPAFTGVGQVRVASLGGDTVVQGSTDLDATPEFEVAVRGSVVLTADDFVL